MKILILSFILLFHSITFAQDIISRTKASKVLMDIYQRNCHVEDRNSDLTSEIKDAFELAAIYIIHGEYNNMKEQILKARVISKNRNCQQAIDDYLN